MQSSLVLITVIIYIGYVYVDAKFPLKPSSLKGLFNVTSDINDTSRDKFPLTKLVKKFPIEELFGLTPSEVEKFSSYFRDYLCTEKDNPKWCDCNATSCMATRSCCVDILWHEDRYASLDDYLKEFKSVADSHPHRSCRYVFPAATRYKYRSKRRMFVKQCPSSSTTVEKMKCKEGNQALSQNIPVVSTTDSKLVFSNHHCARCNKVCEFTYLTLKLSCRAFNWKISAKKRKMKSKAAGCWIDLLDEDASTGCKLNRLHSQCPVNDPLHDLCNLYSGKFGCHKNFHCWRCKNPKLRPTFVQYDTPCSPRQGKVKKMKRPWSFTLTSNERASRIKGYSPKKKKVLDLKCPGRMSFNLKDFTCGNEIPGEETCTSQKEEERTTINKVEQTEDFKTERVERNKNHGKCHKRGTAQNSGTYRTPNFFPIFFSVLATFFMARMLD